MAQFRVSLIIVTLSHLLATTRDEEVDLDNMTTSGVSELFIAPMDFLIYFVPPV